MPASSTEDPDSHHKGGRRRSRRQGVRIAVDTGGTFTDVLLEHPDGRLVSYKLPSTPDDPGRAVVDGVRGVLQRAAVDIAELDSVLHGTTVATNALLERDGARTLLVATAGFEDVLELGRQARPHLYELEIHKPPPLVDPGDALGLAERLGPDGSVERALTAESIETLMQALRGRLETHTDDRALAVAVCLLHAYANDTHERRVLEAIVERFGDRLDYVCRSSEVLAELRELERASTTVANAFVAPRMARYLRRLDARLSALPGARSPRLRIMQSNGGLMSASEAAAWPVQTALSGPAGGVLGGLEAARVAGVERVVTFDMGGTSSDVGFCDGRVALSSEGGVGTIPVRIPMVDLHTVGAGGGSLARIDVGGALKVGPESAGARPGPACYGRGGTRPAVSDAHVVLGRLLPGHFLGGEMTLDVEAARAAVREHVAEPLGVELEQAAAGILAVVDASMARAIKVMSVERGHVPGSLALVAFGGAGALHACTLAESVGIPTVIVPPRPGLLSADGMLRADLVRFASRSLVVALRTDDEAVTAEVRDTLDTALEALTGRVRALLAEDGAAADEVALETEAELRYHGQSFELAVAWDTVSAMREAFEASHEARYGYRMSDADIELVTVRVRGRVAVGAPPASRAVEAVAPASAVAHETVRVWFAGEWQAARHVVRDGLRVGARLEGPAIVTEYTATTVVPPGWRLEVASGGAMRLSRVVP